MQKFPVKSEAEFKRYLIRQYLKFGTVESVFRQHKYDLPISYAQYQRILDEMEIVKSVGPNSKLVEAIDFMSHLARESIPVEDLYKKLPLNFRTSLKTLYRILGYVKEGLTRRVGVALVITPFNDKKSILVAKDISTPRLELGKEYGALSLPMGYARKRDGKRLNIKRILQQEVFSEKTAECKFPEEMLEGNLEPFMYLDIADVRVSVFHLQLSKDYSDIKSFFSYKLKDYCFESIERILKTPKQRVRAGVKEAVGGYERYLRLLARNLTVNPLQETSLLNKELATVTLDIED